MMDLVSIDNTPSISPGYKLITQDMKTSGKSGKVTRP